MRKVGQTEWLRKMVVGASRMLDPSRVSDPKNLHVLAARLDMKIAVRAVRKGRNAGKLEVFRLR